MIRSVFSNTSRRSTQVARRSFVSSNAADNVLVQMSFDESNAVATLTMANPPVNSLSLEMCQAMSAAVKEIERNQSIQSVVLKSSNSSVFSAGLDILEMANPNTDRLEKFWLSLQDCFMDLYGTRLATIAAIEGHAPAGGCMLAMACDYRIMKKGESAGIGLNETQLGIAAPFWMADLLVRTVGHRCAEKSLALGSLYKSNEALNIGLVDEIHDDVLARAMAVSSIWAKVPTHARQSSKMLTRKKIVDELKSRRQEDLEIFTKFILNSEVQKNLTKYLASLKKK